MPHGETFPMRGIASVQTAREPAVPETARRLSITLVGRLALRLDGHPVELRTRKAAAVLGYLALSDTKSEIRERLVGLLWSRSDEEKARASLRQVVRELRHALDAAGFAAGRLSIGFDPAKVEVDVESILQQAENARIHPLLLNTQRLDERLLEGMDDLDPSFRVWILAKRQTIYERLMRSLDAGLAAAQVSAETKRKIATAIANLDPTHELACCRLMQAHAEDGDAAGALRIYKGLWDLLDRDYGMEPSKATHAWVASTKLGALERKRAGRPEHSEADLHGASASGSAVMPAFQPAKTAAKPCLVLRPFAMNGVPSSQAHLVQGFSQHLA